MKNNKVGRSKSSSSRKMSVYSNLATRRRNSKDSRSRKKAEYLASLPKHPLKRLLYRLHPKRVFNYWFSRKGLFMVLKISGALVITAALIVGGLLMYYRKDLDAIRPGELAKRVQTTVTRYYDRNNKLLWEDKGEDSYKQVVKSDQINKYMKDATIAIEDRDFYEHKGVSISGITRAAINNMKGGSTQGGSTLTQQLVKQVFFAEESGDRGLSGIPRKIKEMILSIEVERLFDKDQILTLYLNESPYGGRRNGVQSAAKTYFGKDAKKLTLAEASLLAAIPQNPSTFDPYNKAGHKALLERQHKVLDDMVRENMIEQKQADAAKKFPILESIRPAADKYKGIKAPHFVRMVQSQLESELGKATVGRGGLTVKTTLDIRVQNKLENAIDDMFKTSTPEIAGFSNAASVIEDVKTGQVIALDGSRDFNYPGFGQDNATTEYIQPGSTIKPLIYAELMKPRPDGFNYGSGSLLNDANTPDLLAAYGTTVNNVDKTFKGPMTIRNALAQSRNIPVIRAMMTTGVQETLQSVRDMGDKGYCTQGQEVQVGLAAAIGGCGTKQTDHVNAFSTLARGGEYKPQTYILSVKNSQGEVLKKWKDEGSRILDAQIPYIISDILNDDGARKPLFGSITTGFSYGDTGIRTATKTGTSDIGGQARDLWMMTYSPAVTMGVWFGNPTPKQLNQGNSTLPGPVVDSVMRYVHQEIYQKSGKWKPGDWFKEPDGIQEIKGELYPSWFNKNQLPSNKKMTFDRVSKKLATDCTPESARINVEVTVTTVPSTKKKVITAPNGYDSSKKDDVHKCDDATPSVAGIEMTRAGKNSYTITASVAKGSHQLKSVEILVDGKTVNSQSISRGGDYATTATITEPGKHEVSVTVTDEAYYETSASRTFGIGRSSRDDD